MWRAFREASQTKSDKVIQMERFRSGKSLSPLRQAEAYWAALCADGQVPRRSQIDPRGLENILSYTFVVERIAPGMARFRVAGQHLAQIAGMEVRGMPLSTFFAARDRAEIGATLERVFDAPAISELSLVSEMGGFEGRMILLPLRSDLGQVNRALGVVIADVAELQGNTRFCIRRSDLRVVPGAQAARSVDVSEQAEQGFAEARAAFKTPHLRVVK